jgi:streptogramin lyase
MKTPARGRSKHSQGSARKVDVIFFFFLLLCLSLAIIFYTYKFNPLPKLISSNQPVWKTNTQVEKEGAVKPLEQILEVTINFDASAKPNLAITSAMIKNGRAPIPSSNGSYKLELVDGYNNPLSFTKFNAESTLMPAPPLPGEKVIEPMSTRSKYAFSLTLKYFSDAVSVRILDENGNIIVSSKNFIKVSGDETSGYKSITGDQILNPDKHSPLNNLLRQTVGVYAQSQTPQYLDIAIIGHGFTTATMSTFHTNVNKITASLLTYEPYKSRASQIRFSYIDNTTPLGCTYSGRCIVCNDSLVTNAVNNSQVPYDNIYVLVADTTYGGCYDWNIAAGSSDPTWMGQLFVHENGGHAIGQIADEYNAGFIEWSNKNCYAGVPPNSLWKNLIPDSSYYGECQIGTQYRTSPDSIMRNIAPTYFNTISKYFINQQLDYYTGAINQTPTPTPTATPTPTPKSTPTPIPTSTPTPTPTFSPTPTPSKSNCGVIPTPYPTPIPFSTTDWINNPTTMYCSGSSGYSADFPRFNQLIIFQNAIEWYRLDHGTYPVCDCIDDWSNVDCLRGKLSLYLFDLVSNRDSFLNDPTYPYRYRPYSPDASNNYQGYCLSSHYDYCPGENRGCPLGDPNTNYQFHIKDRPNHDILPYRFTPNKNLSQTTKNNNDAQRKADVAKIVAAVEAYKKDKGYYPQTQYDYWSNSNIQKDLIPTYLSGYLLGPSDPNFAGYANRMWNKDASGKFTKYCVAAYMENVANCHNGCDIPLTGFDCYSIGNSTQLVTTPGLKPTSTPTSAPKPTSTPTPIPTPTPVPKFSCTKYSLSSVWGSKAKAIPGYPDGWFNHGAANGQFFNPKGIDSDNYGNIYVADTGNNRIQKISNSGVFLAKWGSKGTGNGQFSGPVSIALDASNNVYVVDSSTNSKIDRVQKFDSLGKFLFTWGQSGTGQSQFNNASNIAVDKNGYVYVSDLGNSRIQKFSSEGKFVAMWGSRGSGNGQFINPRGMAFDSVGRIYVADSGNHRIQIFDPNGVYLSKYGTNCQTTNSNSCTGKFFWPVDVDIDSSDSIYVLESENNRVQKFNKELVYITSIGSYAKSIGTIGAFRSPSDITLNSSGNIFVADYNRDNIQKFSCQ